MGVDSKRSIPPLPAPTETDTSMGTGTELATEVSRVTDKSSYSIPEDGSPITISTRKKKHDKDGDISKGNHPSQTSLLIEYFEGGKDSKTGARRPSVRVKVTPSKESRNRSARGDADHIQITETKSGSRKPSYSKRINLVPSSTGDKLFGEELDSRSALSYSEGSNVTSHSGHPIEIEVMPRRHGSPLIPNGESTVSGRTVNFQQMGSDVSSMPADSFLDGKARSPVRKRSQSLSRGEKLAAGGAAALAASAVAEELVERRRSRSLSRERVPQKSEISEISETSLASGKSSHREKSSHRDDSKRRHKHRESRSRSASRSEKHGESVKSPRRRSSRSHQEESSLISGSDPSQLTTSRVSDNRSYRSGTSSINNPKLLETVEDAIRRLILPELTALKAEQKANKTKSERERRGSITPGSSALSRESQEETTSSRRRVSGRSSSGDVKSKDGGEIISGSSGKIRKKHRSEQSDMSYETGSPRSERYTSEETSTRDGGDGQRKSSREKGGRFSALAAGAGLGALTAAALRGHDSKEHLDEREERRRRRKGHARQESGVNDSFENVKERTRMPMMSEVTASDLTRTSILSADTERPHSASEEQMTPIREVHVQEVNHGYISPTTQTPTRSPNATVNSLGMRHGNHSVNDLSRSGESLHQRGEYQLDQYGNKIPLRESSYDGSYIEEDYKPDHGVRNALAAGTAGAAAGALLAKHHDDVHDYDPEEEDYDHQYYQQEVPPPLRYVPYNQEKRGLSPIPQSVSSYREDDGQNGDSRTTRSQSYSTLNQSPRHKSEMSMDSSGRTNPKDHDFPEVRFGGLTDSELTHEGEYHDGEHPENVRARDWDEHSHGVESSFDPKHHTGDPMSTVSESQSDSVAAGQSVRGVGAVPDYVHTPFGVESNVASLVSASNVTGDSGSSGLDRKASYASYDEGSERHFMSRGHSPAKRDSQADTGYDGFDFESRRGSISNDYPEYELDEEGRKVTMPNYNEKDHSTTKALGAGAVGAAAGAAMAKYMQSRSASAQRAAPQSQEEDHFEEVNETTGAPQQRSFKDRAAEMSGPPRSPRHSVDKLLDDEEHITSLYRDPSVKVKLGASGLPDLHDPMPEIGHYQDDISEVGTQHSVVHTPLGDTHNGNKDYWSGDRGTPTRASQREYDEDVRSGRGTPRSSTQRLYNAHNISGNVTPRHSTQHLYEEGNRSGQQTPRSGQNTPGLKAAELAMLGAATGMGVGAAVAQHSREANQSHGDDWQRTSEERKRDTLITNPYEGQSPAGINSFNEERELPLGLDHDYGVGKLNYDSGFTKDEGYISSIPNQKSPISRKAVGFTDAMDRSIMDAGIPGDPFYTPKHARDVSGMSHGMGSPLYDAATGSGMDRIQNKDIVALMDHLTVRDAQRSARDTEILMTLVQAAAEMRNSFQEMRKLILDSEDVIIQEVERNTDKSVQKVINGPRPLPPSSSRSARNSQDDYINDIPNKRRNVFRRALQGLSGKSSNDLNHIEEMLVRLLGEVEGLKAAQHLGAGGNDLDQYDDADQEGAYEQDRGYEPEGHAGTSTASYASQSGHFSQRGGSATRLTGSRKFSDHRISTVPEDDEEEHDVELDPHEQALLNTQFEGNENLLTPTRDIRGSSAPLATPPQQYVPPASQSNENTPITDKSKKHKSSSSSGWIPKISRWSETTASTVAQKFRSSNRNSGRKEAYAAGDEVPPSRSGSNLGDYEDHDPYGADKLHSGYSQDDIDYDDSQSPRGLSSILPPEEPKYKAERRSLLIEHPQPRQGPTHIYQTALESQAQNFNTPMSPKSLDWGSSTSINRLPANANANRYSNQSGNTLGPPSGHTIERGSSALSEHDYDSPSTYMRAAAAPARPPKEPITSSPLGPEKPPKVRNGKLVKPSPLSNEHLRDDSDEQGKRFSGASASDERRVGGNGMAFAQQSGGLSAKLGVPARKPTGPRSMGSPRGALGIINGEGPRSPEVEDLTVGRNKNRGKTTETWVWGRTVD